MKQTSANLILEGKREIRAIGDQCDASCFVWYTCTNSKPNGSCEGFLLLHNGEVKRHLNTMLNEDDVVYVQNCMRIAQNDGCSEETKERLVQEVLRFIPPQPSPRQEGFLAMLESAFPTRTEHQEEPEPHFKSEFQQMLEESGKTAHSQTTSLTRGIDESQFPDLCDPTKCPPNYVRHCRANREDHYGQPCIYITLKNR